MEETEANMTFLGCYSVYHLIYWKMAARDLDTRVRVELKAYGIGGEPMPTFVSVYAEDEDDIVLLRKLYWGHVIPHLSEIMVLAGQQIRRWNRIKE